MAGSVGILRQSASVIDGMNHNQSNRIAINCTVAMAAVVVESSKAAS